MSLPADPALDLATFAERVLGRPLWPHQIEAAGSERFVTVIAKARRTGGTTLIQALAAWTCFRERNVKAVILSAGQEASRRVTEELGAELAASPLTRGAVVDDFSTRIRLANGSEIVSLPASQRQVRGLGRGVKLLVIDEAGFVEEQLWRAAHYVALDERANGSRIVLCGTPWGGQDAFFRRAFQAGQDGDPDHASFHWTYRANPRLDRAYLERQHDRVSPAEYAAEVLGEWSDATGSLFTRALLDSAIADIDPWTLATLPEGPRLMVGVDWGVSFDRSAAVAIARLPVADLNPDRDPLPVFGIVSVEVWPAGAPLTSVAQAVANSTARWSAISSEVSGVGAGPSQEVRARAYERALRDRARHYVFNAVHTTSALKTTGYGWLLNLLERGQLVLPRDPTLLRQLAGLKFEQRERGFVRIEPESAVVHDDVADAAMLAVGPYSSNGRPRCLLANMVRAAKGIPDAAVPALAEPVVETASLCLYRRPPLQSVDGSELVLPPTTVRADRRAPEHPVLVPSSRPERESDPVSSRSIETTTPEESWAGNPLGIVSQGQVPVFHAAGCPARPERVESYLATRSARKNEPAKELRVVRCCDCGSHFATPTEE